MGPLEVRVMTGSHAQAGDLKHVGLDLPTGRRGWTLGQSGVRLSQQGPLFTHSCLAHSQTQAGSQGSVRWGPSPHSGAQTGHRVSAGKSLVILGPRAPHPKDCQALSPSGSRAGGSGSGRGGPAQ